MEVAVDLSWDRLHGDCCFTSTVARKMYLLMLQLRFFFEAFTAEAQPPSQASLLGFCYSQSGSGIGFSSSVSVFTCQWHSTGASCAFIHLPPELYCLNIWHQFSIKEDHKIWFLPSWPSSFEILWRTFKLLQFSDACQLQICVTLVNVCVLLALRWSGVFIIKLLWQLTLLASVLESFLVLQNFPFLSHKYIVKIMQSSKVIVIQNDFVLNGFVNMGFLFRSYVS